ncbi:hypothetical protein Pcinc_025503 [Petrolisthes cinctipes]|uniref:Uncharacterized protein n=1 Tax=Petrolisthes cinctipes TaxID=88211 RepID=A0AAE1KCY9_PETCI|nr:hypothetical protein Pcinc_025503 [Petrolisthes cinctipes]
MEDLEDSNNPTTPTTPTPTTPTPTGTATTPTDTDTYLDATTITTTASPSPHSEVCEGLADLVFLQCREEGCTTVPARRLWRNLEDTLQYIRPRWVLEALREKICHGDDERELDQQTYQNCLLEWLHENAIDLQQLTGNSDGDNKNEGDNENGDKNESDSDNGDKNESDSENGDKNESDSENGDKNESDSDNGDKNSNTDDYPNCNTKTTDFDKTYDDNTTIHDHKSGSNIKDDDEDNSYWKTSTPNSQPSGISSNTNNDDYSNLSNINRQHSANNTASFFLSSSNGGVLSGDVVLEASEEGAGADVVIGVEKVVVVGTREGDNKVETVKDECSEIGRLADGNSEVETVKDEGDELGSFVNREVEVETLGNSDCGLQSDVNVEVIHFGQLMDDVDGGGAFGGDPVFRDVNDVELEGITTVDDNVLFWEVTANGSDVTFGPVTADENRDNAIEGKNITTTGVMALGVEREKDANDKVTAVAENVLVNEEAISSEWFTSSDGEDKDDVTLDRVTGTESVVIEEMPTLVNKDDFIVCGITVIEDKDDDDDVCKGVMNTKERVTTSIDKDVLIKELSGVEDVLVEEVSSIEDEDGALKWMSCIEHQDDIGTPVERSDDGMMKAIVDHEDFGTLIANFTDPVASEDGVMEAIVDHEDLTEPTSLTPEQQDDVTTIPGDVTPLPYLGDGDLDLPRTQDLLVRSALLQEIVFGSNR